MDIEQEFLASIKIATPCNADWDKMSGDERMRYCQQCKLNVYNFSEMTTKEVMELIEDAEGRVCGQVYRRRDGTVITADCPKGLERARKAWRRCAAAVLGLVAWIGVTVPARAEPPQVERGDVCTMGKVAPAQQSEPQVRVEMGEVACNTEDPPVPATKPAATPLSTPVNYNQKSPEEKPWLAIVLSTLLLGGLYGVVFKLMKKRSSLWIIGTAVVCVFAAIGFIWIVPVGGF